MMSAEERKENGEELKKLTQEEMKYVTGSMATGYTGGGCPSCHSKDWTPSVNPGQRHCEGCGRDYYPTN